MATVEKPVQCEAPLRGVMPDVPAFILDWRRTSGADRYDEMWDGVLHMPPEANREHGDFQFCLHSWLKDYWAVPTGGRVHNPINVSPTLENWRKNYRVPDLVLLSPDRFAIDHNEVFVGAPLVVVEIHSPGDEAYEKLPFYAALGVPEVWIFHRDSKEPEIRALAGDAYLLLAADPRGWHRSAATGMECRVVNPGRLTLRMAGDTASEEEIPEQV
jgi:Uma2 family endonuclease